MSEMATINDHSISSNDQEWTHSVLCRYFMNGSCKRGDSCCYSHDVSLSSSETGYGSIYNQPGTSNHGINCFETSADAISGDTSNEESLLNNPTIEVKNFKPLRSWADAPVFVPSSEKIVMPSLSSFAVAENADTPKLVGNNKSKWSSSGGQRTWAHVVNADAMLEMPVLEAQSYLCPFFIQSGECPNGYQCAYVHGEMCDLCLTYTLHPSHERQRKHHRALCIKEHEEEMERAFAVARSEFKTCGICMEVVIEKSMGKGRFGILPNCNHCFCLECLRKWRQAKQFENNVVRACPECRQTSDYVCPSLYWVETKEEKETLLSSYREALHIKECKYFKRGKGQCPFGNKCFYRHADANGTYVDVGPPPRRSTQRTNNEDDEINQLILADYMNERNGRLPLLDFSQLLDQIEMLQEVSFEVDDEIDDDDYFNDDEDDYDDIDHEMGLMSVFIQ